MEYAILLKDYGQGGITAVPDSQCTGENKSDFRRPYTAYEVLTDFFGEDMSLVLGNYLKQEIKTMPTENTIDTLILVGNGFDIWQGVSTSYSDLEKYYIEISLLY